MKQITKTTLTLFAMSILMSFAGMGQAQNKQDVDKVLEPFPKATEGIVRHVIQLDEKSDESIYKIEIIPGKVMSVDCNLHSLMGNLEEKNLEGWGYSYYEFTSNGQATSTMKACNEPNKDKFVAGQTMLVRYNSRLPIVVYAPQGYEIKYRIWEAGDDQSPIVK